MSPKDEDGVVCDHWTKHFSFSPGSKLPEGALPGVSVPHLCAEDTLKVFPLKLESQGESGLCARLFRWPWTAVGFSQLAKWSVVNAETHNWSKC